MASLALAGLVTISLFALNRAKVRSLGPHILLGIAGWVFTLKSGVHATLAGVILAAFIPAGNRSGHKTSPAGLLEHALHPWVVFGILAVFAFANAGVSLQVLSPAMLLAPVPLGIALGLFLGKQIGVFSGSWLAVRFGWAKLPDGVNWRQIHGLAALCGIGFTMSLFIGSPAFEGAGGPDYAVDDRIGILTGSFLSAIAGVTLLLKRSKAKQREHSQTELDSAGKSSSDVRSETRDPIPAASIN